MVWRSQSQLNTLSIPSPLRIGDSLDIVSVLEVFPQKSFRLSGMGFGNRFEQWVTPMLVKHDVERFTWSARSIVPAMGI